MKPAFAVSAIALAGGCVGAVLLAASSLTYDPRMPAANLARGRWLFEQRCAQCHAKTEGRLSTGGPNLARIGVEGATRKPGTSAEQYALESILRPAAFRREGETGIMPVDVAKGLNDTDVISLAAFLLTPADGSPRSFATLSYEARRILHAPAAPAAGPSSAESRPSPGSPAPGPQRIPDLATLELGRRTFYGKGQCARCHQIDERPGFALMAPNLRGIALKDLAYIYQSIKTPDAHVVPGYEAAVCSVGGRVLTGRLLSRTADEVTMMVADAGGRPSVVRIPAAEIEADPGLSVQPRSPMPDTSGILNDEEARAVALFLRSVE